MENNILPEKEEHKEGKLVTISGLLVSSDIFPK